MRIIGFTPFLIGLIPFFCVALDSGIRADKVEERPYRQYVAECLDNLIRYGTDQYGPVHQPLLVTTLDVRTKQRPAPSDDVLARGRVQRADCNKNRRLGCEPLVDQATIDAFYLMSERSGDPHYAAFADSYLRSAMKLTCRKGLFWWGWHRHYDVDKDEKVTTKGNNHEIHILRPRWERMWQIDPKAVEAELEGIWRWHIVNKETGEHNRHADARRGRSFPMSGGEFVYALSFLYRLCRAV